MAARFSTRSLAGRWSAWRGAAPEAEDAPDVLTREAAREASWRLGSPYWTGPSDGIRYRLRGPVIRLRAYFVHSSAVAVPPRTLSIAGSPLIVPRLGWSANERIRRAPPKYAPALRLAIVHHTAGSNSYRPSQSPAIVRAIEIYHVLGNGWNDIGYNFLVDKYGQIFEGRYGGMTRAVIGAHAMGFNVGSVGVSVIGNYSAATVIVYGITYEHDTPLTNELTAAVAGMAISTLMRSSIEVPTAVGLAEKMLSGATWSRV